MAEKYAIEFDIMVHDEIMEYDGYFLVGDSPHLGSCFEFDVDYWNWFQEDDDVKKLETGDYHVFHYGNVSWEYSRDWESGINEFDGLIFEPEHKSISKMGA